MNFHFLQILSCGLTGYTDLSIDEGVVVDNGTYKRLDYHDPRGKVLFDADGKLQFADKIGVIPEYFTRRRD